MDLDLSLTIMMFCVFLLAYTPVQYDHPIWVYRICLDLDVILGLVNLTTICALMYDLWPDTQYEATEDIESEENGVEDWDSNSDE